jgi:hypothetical protein
VSCAFQCRFRDTIPSDIIKQNEEESCLCNKKIDIVTYRIYFNGNIEKHIQESDSCRNEYKYKYEYIPKEEKQSTWEAIRCTKAFGGGKDEYVNS